MSRPKIIDYKYINRDGTMYVDERFIDDSYEYMNKLEKALDKACICLSSADKIFESVDIFYQAKSKDEWKEWCLKE